MKKFSKKFIISFVRKVRKEFDFSSIKIGKSTKSTGRFKINHKVFEEFKEKYPGFIDNLGELVFLYNHLKKPKAYANKRLCNTCGKRTPWVGFYSENGYQSHCCKNCGANDPKILAIITEKRKKTCMEKYGVDNIRKHPDVIKKIQKILQKDRQENPEKYKEALRIGFLSKESRKKCQKVCEERYGTKTPFQSKEFQKRIQEKNLREIGAKTHISLPEVREKIKHTMLKRYGVLNSMQSEEIRKKSKNTFMKKYGVSHPMQVESIKNRARISLKIFNSSQEGKELRFEKNLKVRKEFYLKDRKYLLKEKKIKPLFDKDEYLKPTNDFQFKCLECKKKFSYYVGYRMVGVKCPTCSQDRHTSFPELKIRRWLERIGLKPVKTRKLVINPLTGLPLEIDMYCKKEKIGIEFNGVYWHSAKRDEIEFRPKIKFQQCLDKGIRLFQIFEHEWWDDNKRKIIKSLIKRTAGLTEGSKTVYARKCSITEVSNNEYKDFLIKNHIQGYVGAKVKLGLNYQDRLVAIASFGPSRFKKGETELLRFCIRKNWNVIGGLSKLVKNYVRLYGPDKLISYVDTRFFDGRGYLSSGFIKLYHSRPNYFYEKDGISYSRIKFQKHKLEKELDLFDPELSEFENMMNNGYKRLYDSGSLKMEYVG